MRFEIDTDIEIEIEFGVIYKAVADTCTSVLAFFSFFSFRFSCLLLLSPLDVVLILVFAVPQPCTWCMPTFLLSPVFFVRSMIMFRFLFVVVNASAICKVMVGASVLFFSFFSRFFRACLYSSLFFVLVLELALVLNIFLADFAGPH